MQMAGSDGIMPVCENDHACLATRPSWRRKSTSPREPEEEPEEDDGKDPAAVALGRKGGREKMTPEERSEAARKAAKARWTKAESKDDS